MMNGFGWALVFGVAVCLLMMVVMMGGVGMAARRWRDRQR